MALERSSATNESSRSEKTICLIWGCQLNDENRTYTFDVPEEWSYEQQLALRTVCLGENAKDEFNVVEIEPPVDSKQSTPVHIATLKLSVLPMAALAGFDLTPPVTFRLKSGSGPVYLAGQHVTVGSQWNEEDDEEEEVSSSDKDEEAQDSSKEGSPVIPVKQPPVKRVFTAKKEQEQAVQEQSQGQKTGRGRKPTGKGELRI
ncbi:hypothetical protein JRQ81_010867 [Phrynocephalus forsythii]|uniref:Nucleoplasmin core domain-containing protein n=1 Tax=Phrynocephalus forsythii TaxID=171643 RepID=A0A9Q0X858_9SAUR|nr:hypothetical protein JRQ81_010867 [Phrynocephalus forsythii]